MLHATIHSKKDAYQGALGTAIISDEGKSEDTFIPEHLKTIADYFKKQNKRIIVPTGMTLASTGRWSLTDACRG